MAVMVQKVQKVWGLERSQLRETETQVSAQPPPAQPQPSPSLCLPAKFPPPPCHMSCLGHVGGEEEAMRERR